MQIITSAIDSRDGVFSGGKQSPSDNSLIPTPMTTKSALTAPTLIVVGMAVSLVAGSSARADIRYDCTDRFGRTQTYITRGSAVCPDQPRVIIPVNVGYPSLPTMVYPTEPQLQPTVTPVGYPHAPTISYPKPYINIDFAPW